MRLSILAMVLVGLVGCGADGEPIRPEAELGISISRDELRPSASIGVSKGPVTITLGR